MTILSESCFQEEKINIILMHGDEIKYTYIYIKYPAYTNKLIKIQLKPTH